MTNQRFRINTPTVTHETIEGEAVIINLESGNYYSLVDAGSFIWSLIEKGASASDIQNSVLQSYQAGAADVERGVADLLGQLQQESLIVPVDGADPKSPNQAVPSDNNHDKPSFNPPSLNKYTDMQELLLLDPIHDVDEAGWPKPNPDFPK
jgi:hypothetical protein